MSVIKNSTVMTGNQFARVYPRGLTKACLLCGKMFSRDEKPWSLANITAWNNAKYCSKECSWKAFAEFARQHHSALGNHTPHTFSTSNGKSPLFGKKRPPEVVAKINERRPRGEKHYRWNPNREEIKRNLRNDGGYLQWVSAVKKRDHNTCQLKDENCKGNLIVHHIIPWAKSVELRYQINNGITLCQFHHPRKRDDEQRLIPVFQQLVGSK
jgi:hypothetical protein